MSRKETAEAPEDIQQPMVDMKSHILTVASGIILEKGLKNTSLKDIAKTAGISKGTLHYYYSAKEDLIYDIAERNMREITDELLSWIDRRDSAADLETVLCSLFQKILEAETRERLHLYLLNDAVTSDEALAQKFQKLYADWRAILRDALKKVLPEEGKAETLSYLILAALDGLMIQKMCGAEEIPVSGIIHQILK